MDEKIKAALAVIEEAKTEVGQARELARLVRILELIDDSISKEFDMVFVGSLLLNLLDRAFERIDSGIWEAEQAMKADNGADKEGSNGK